MLSQRKIRLLMARNSNVDNENNTAYVNFNEKLANEQALEISKRIYVETKKFLGGYESLLKENPHATIAPQNKCKIIGTNMYIPVYGITKITSAAQFLGSMIFYFHNSKVNYSQYTELSGSASNIELIIPLAAGVSQTQIANNAGFFSFLSEPKTLFWVFVTILVLLATLNLVFEMPSEKKLEVLDGCWCYTSSWFPWNWKRGKTFEECFKISNNQSSDNNNNAKRSSLDRTQESEDDPMCQLKNKEIQSKLIQKNREPSRLPEGVSDDSYRHRKS